MEKPKAFGVSREKLGRLIRAERQRLYKRPADFLNDLQYKTGYVISEQSLYKYERGKTNMPIDLLVSIAMTMYGLDWMPFLTDMLQFAFSDDLTFRESVLKHLGHSEEYAARKNLIDNASGCPSERWDYYRSTDGKLYRVELDPYERGKVWISEPQEVTSYLRFNAASIEALEKSIEEQIHD